MYIATIPNRNSPPAILLRESYRQNGKVKNRTLANLSKWPPDKVEALRQALKGKASISPDEAFEIHRSLPHGHIAAVIGTLKKIKLDHIIASKRSFHRDVVVAMIAARIIDPASKLATARGLRDETAFTSLGEILGVTSVTEVNLYEAMDWLFSRKDRIEKTLARKHLGEGSLILYDVTSTYFEGNKCSLAKWGHNRDGKKDKLQIVIGVLCNAGGCPVGVEVFEGNMSDTKTLKVQIQKIRQRFGIQRMVLVGDRGLITESRIRDELGADKDLDWITALRAPAIKKLVMEKVLQPSLFDEWGLCEIRSEDYPGERLIVCRNPLLAEERRRKREELLAVTEGELEKIKRATKRDKRRLKGADKIGIRVGRVLNRYKMGKHFKLEITDDGFTYTRNEGKVQLETSLDGIYIVRTSVNKEELGSEEVVKAYKNLSVVERTFRSLKTVDLKVRPVYHWLADRVRAHVFLCMLAYYVEWHMRIALAPILFDDDNKLEVESQRSSAVAPAVRSKRAQQKARIKRTEEDMPVHSFRTLLKDLTTLTKNWVIPKVNSGAPFVMFSNPTPLQKKVFELLGISYKM